MTKTAEKRPSPHSAETVLSELKTAVARRDWRLARFRVETLRFGHGWRYARFAAEFGSERWEEIAQEIDDAESSDE